MAENWKAYHSREADAALAGKLKWVVAVATVAVFGLVGLMRQVTIPLPEGVDLGMLPPFHAVLNGCAAVVLLAALFAIKARKVGLHRRLIYTAMALSGVFLLSYVAYHFTSGETIFGDLNGDGELQADEREALGGTRAVYLSILLSHIVDRGDIGMVEGSCQSRLLLKSSTPFRIPRQLR